MPEIAVPDRPDTPFRLRGRTLIFCVNDEGLAIEVRPSPGELQRKEMVWIREQLRPAIEQAAAKIGRPIVIGEPRMTHNRRKRTNDQP